MIDTYAASNIVECAVQVGSAARKAEELKRRKYTGLATTYLFEPLAFETTGVYGDTTSLVIKELGSRLSSTSGDLRETAWLRQRISVAPQRECHLHSRLGWTILGGRPLVQFYIFTPFRQ